ncbi:hypothetical protein L2E82_06224 [Cichorium intybus]|uniref:Uncharacterized protein n=1 Tax=Cichorium intybus TaxID=13427 RepID=A0ACB9H9W8_CICIN|nr:hypothetical protein L2E82_06224 [Cichorium intybus]
MIPLLGFFSRMGPEEGGGLGFDADDFDWFPCQFRSRNMMSMSRIGGCDLVIQAYTRAELWMHFRARVIAQWADSKNKIQEAIEACPVDCISMVERLKLAALEFLISKQPHGNVRIGAGNTVGRF